jgi:hypothetical protein
MSIEGYRCTNPKCDAITTVRFWPATRLDPPDSTWGDGCSACGEELQDEPEEPEEPDYEPDYESLSEPTGPPPRGSEWEDPKGRTP